MNELQLYVINRGKRERMNWKLYKTGKREKFHNNDKPRNKGGGNREYKVRKEEALDQKHCESKTTTTSSEGPPDL